MSEAARGAPARLLLVEDDEDIRVVFARWLRAEGYDIAEATSLVEALDRLGSHRPEALCLDLNLPDASGIDALDTLRGHPIASLEQLKELLTANAALE